MAHKPHEECGLFGIYNKDGLQVAEETYLALYALQHRGQESAGIAVNDGGVITVHKDMGLVPDVFDEKTIKKLGSGQLAIGHVRYSPSDKLERANSQPLVMRYVKGTLAIGHNGSIVNIPELKRSWNTAAPSSRPPATRRSSPISSPGSGSTPVPSSRRWSTP